MELKTDNISGEVSFRGLGFVEIGGILHGVCGSRRFNVGLRSSVRWVKEQLEMCKAEEPRDAVFEVQVDVSGETPVIYDGRQRVKGRELLRGGYLEGVPLGVVYDGHIFNSYWLVPPPDHAWPNCIVMPLAFKPATSGLFAHFSSPLFFRGEFDDELGDIFYTYISAR